MKEKPGRLDRDLLKSNSPESLLNAIDAVAIDVLASEGAVWDDVKIFT